MAFAYRDMRLSWILTILSICLSALVTATGAEGKRKLQIGVKKRVDHCPIKSRKGDVLHMHYTGKLEDGTEFDSSLPQNQPFVFSLGTGQVIKGWDQGLLGMCEGEKRKLVIPSELGYGERGAPPKIPGGATLVFEVELLKIERRPELQPAAEGQEAPPGTRFFWGVLSFCMPRILSSRPEMKASVGL